MNTDLFVIQIFISSWICSVNTGEWMVRKKRREKEMDGTRWCSFVHRMTFSSEVLAFFCLFGGFLRFECLHIGFCDCFLAFICSFPHFLVPRLILKFSENFSFFSNLESVFEFNRFFELFSTFSIYSDIFNFFRLFSILSDSFLFFPILSDSLNIFLYFQFFCQFFPFFSDFFRVFSDSQCFTTSLLTISSTQHQQHSNPRNSSKPRQSHCRKPQIFHIEYSMAKKKIVQKIRSRKSKMSTHQSDVGWNEQQKCGLSCVTRWIHGKDKMIFHCTTFFFFVLCV